MLSAFERISNLIFLFLSSLLNLIFGIQIDEKYTYFGIFVFFLLVNISIVLIRKFVGIGINYRISTNFRSSNSKRGTDK